MKPINEYQREKYIEYKANGEVPEGSRIVVSDHELYIYWPDGKTVIAIHKEGPLTKHITN